MKLSKKNAVVVRKALDGWIGEGALTPEQQQQLLQHMDVQPFDWRRLARYAFLAALASLLIAVTSLFADSELLAWLSELFRFDAPVRMAIAGVLAALAYVWALLPPAASGETLRQRGGAVCRGVAHRLRLMATGGLAG